MNTRPSFQRCFPAAGYGRHIANTHDRLFAPSISGLGVLRSRIQTPPKVEQLRPEHAMKSSQKRSKARCYNSSSDSGCSQQNPASSTATDSSSSFNSSMVPAHQQPGKRSLKTVPKDARNIVHRVLLGLMATSLSLLLFGLLAAHSRGRLLGLEAGFDPRCLGEHMHIGHVKLQSTSADLKL